MIPEFLKPGPGQIVKTGGINFSWYCNRSAVNDSPLMFFWITSCIKTDDNPTQIAMIRFLNVSNGLQWNIFPLIDQMQEAANVFS